MYALTNLTHEGPHCIDIPPRRHAEINQLNSHFNRTPKLAHSPVRLRVYSIDVLLQAMRILMLSISPFTDRSIDISRTGRLLRNSPRNQILFNKYASWIASSVEIFSSISFDSTRP